MSEHPRVRQLGPRAAVAWGFRLLRREPSGSRPASSLSLDLVSARSPELPLLLRHARQEPREANHLRRQRHVEGPSSHVRAGVDRPSTSSIPSISSRRPSTASARRGLSPTLPVDLRSGSRRADLAPAARPYDARRARLDALLAVNPRSVRACLLQKQFHRFRTYYGSRCTPATSPRQADHRCHVLTTVIHEWTQGLTLAQVGFPSTSAVRNSASPGVAESGTVSIDPCRSPP